MEEARRLLIKMINDNVPEQVKICTVESVDKATLSCNVKLIDDEVILYKVRLRASIDDSVDGIYCIPAVDSYVLVSIIKNDMLMNYISLFTEIEEFIVKLGNTEMILNSSGIVFNDGDYGGLIKIEELKTQIDKNSEILDAIKNTFTNWIPVAQDGGAALKILMNTNLTGKTTADLSGIENEKVKH